MECQVTLLNVQHGDCIVIVAGQGEEQVSIVIDGGKARYRAADRLSTLGLLPKTDTEKSRIDLLIGSHHDLDHLDGLVPLVDDDRFDIRRAWAPVVLKPNFDPVFYDPRAETFTEAALVDPDRALDDALLSMEVGLRGIVGFDESRGMGVRLSGANRRILPVNIESYRNAAPRSDSGVVREEDRADLEAFPLVAEMVFLGAQIPGSYGCGERPLPFLEEGELECWGDEEEGEGQQRAMRSTFDLFNSMETRATGQRSHPRHADSLVRALAGTTTRSYYNIKLVASFIRALRRRGIPISMPLASKATSVFVEPHSGRQSPTAPSDTCHIELLSPTKELVERYKKKLAMPPEMLTLARAVNYVTVPNKMSYVFNLVVGDACALLTGDSGFTDFYNSRTSSFDEDRVDRLQLPGLVKVPHHGGHFERFTRCYSHLLDQGKPVKVQHFVTSLGEGHTNPSEEFERFAARLAQHGGGKCNFHFTNPPVRSRFDLVCPQCPRTGEAGGDLISYRSSSGGVWELVSPAQDLCCSELQPHPILPF